MDRTGVESEMNRRLIAIVALLLSLSIAPHSARADDTLVKIVVPVAAGGAPDIVARIIAGPLSQKLGRKVIVENKAGAGERIGAEFVAHAEPDGHTLLLAPPGSLVLARPLFSELRYDPDAFAPVSIVTSGSLVLLARETLEASSVKQLVQMARSAPGKLTYASPGIGTPPHLTGEMFRLASGADFTHVPYKGLAPALADLLAGRIDFMFDNLGNSLANIRAGRVKALGVASEARVPDLPDVPTIAETYPAVRAASWFGVVAPPNTPEQVCARLSRALADVVGEPEVRSKLEAIALRPVGSDPSEMAALLAKERERWAAVVKQAGIKPQ
jgi:tripartite-type tricarboxylate transporter receptor subunit TctC